MYFWSRKPRSPHTSSFVALAVLLVLPASVLHAQITPEQVVEIEQVAQVAIAPDGSRIAYTLIVPRSADEPHGPSHLELRVVPTDGGDPRALFRKPGRASSPAWSPDGRRVAFIATIEEQDENAQVYAIPASGGEPEPLTDSRTGVLQYAWSPNGNSLAYTAREPVPPELAERRERGDDVKVAGEGERGVRLWVQPLAGGEARALTPADRVVRDFIWSPDGSRLALQVTEETGADAGLMFRRLYTVAAAGGAMEPLAETEGKLGTMAWSPDGRRLAFLGATSLDDPLAQSVFVVPASGGTPTNLTPGYRGSATWVGWQDDGIVLFVAERGTRTVLNRVAARGSNIERVAGGGPETFGGISVDRRGRRYATDASTATHPSEVFVGSLRDDELRRLTRHNAWLADVQLARQETIEWTGAEGWTIEGVLVYPLEATPGQRYPLAILPHGGPEGISLDGWTTRPLYPAQVLAGRGYAVLMPNYRGSAGRGVEFSQADHRDLGGREFADVLKGIDRLAERGLVDPERVGISGTSYGGYFSAWGATRHTERFRAAVVFAGLTNWISFTGTTDIPKEMSIVHWDLWWFDNPGQYWDRSPLAWINQARTPTLVAHGMADERVHPEQSIELHTALKLKGVPTGLLLYPREPHGLRERAHELDFMQRLLEWFDRHLKGTAAATR